MSMALPRLSCLNCLLRRLLLCALVLALPTQGLAAATMRFCGPVHHGMAAASAMVLAAEVAAKMAAPDAAADHSTHHGHHGSTEPADSADPLKPPDPAADPRPPASQSSCSACAVCCAALALSSSPPGLPALPAAERSVAALPVGVPVFLTGGPERPPPTFALLTTRGPRVPRHACAVLCCPAAHRLRPRQERLLDARLPMPHPAPRLGCCQGASRPCARPCWPQAR